MIESTGHRNLKTSGDSATITRMRDSDLNRHG